MTNFNTTHTKTSSGIDASAPDLASAPPESAHSLGYWLKVTNRFRRQALKRAFKEAGISRRDLTPDEAGREARTRMRAIAEELNSSAGAIVPAEDMETTMRTLESLARHYGWDENAPMPRGRGRGLGWGRALRHEDGREHERGRGHGHGRGNGCGRMHSGHHSGDHGGHHRGRQRARMAMFAQNSYERGFDAGFSRGRDA